MERSVKLDYGCITTVKTDTNFCRRSYCIIYITNTTVMASRYDYLEEENKVSFDYQMRKTGMGNMDHLNMSSDLSV